MGLIWALWVLIQMLSRGLVTGHYVGGYGSYVGGYGDYGVGYGSYGG